MGLIGIGEPACSIRGDRRGGRESPEASGLTRTAAALAWIGLMALGCGTAPRRPVNRAEPVPMGTLVVENRNLTEWINNHGSTNGDVVVRVGGYVQGVAPAGGAYRMKARAGSHTVTLTRQPGNYCWQDPVSCEVSVVAGRETRIVVTGNERVACAP